MYEEAAEGERASLAEPILGVAGQDAGPTPTAIAPAPSPIAPRATALLEVILCSGYPTQLMLVVILTRLGMHIRTASGTLTPSFILYSLFWMRSS